MQYCFTDVLDEGGHEGAAGTASEGHGGSAAPWGSRAPSLVAATSSTAFSPVGMERGFQPSGFRSLNWNNGSKPRVRY